MAQRYRSNAAALERMRRGMCPECGGEPSRHGGWGGPRGCGLTDFGVADRLHAYETHDRAWHEAGCEQGSSP